LNVDEPERRVEMVETPRDTVEMIKSRAEKSEKRPLQAEEKKEKNKVSTTGLSTLIESIFIFQVVRVL